MAEYSGELDRFNSSASNRQRASALTESLDPARPTNVVHKITSESLRLTIEPPHLQARSPSSNNLEPNKQKKSSSFQITSVTVSSSASNDGEDDSCGEVETEPSEAGGSRNFNDLEVEMFDREDESDSTNVTNNIDSVPVSTIAHHNYTQQVNHSTEAGAIVGGLKFEDKDQQALQQRRFRVVKIESSEPFKRGRWLCMDFLDHPSVQQSISTREEPASSHSSSGSLTENLHVEDLTISNVTVQPNNIPLQAVSSSAVLNPSTQPLLQQQQQQQQPPSQSSIHQVAHSLPASAASINYPAVSPAVQQHQPLYQQQQPQQSSVPVYPVASMASMAAVISNPTSLAMPIIVSQSAGPALPATVGAVPSQTYIQHPSVPAGLLHGNHQPPVTATVVPVQPIFTAPTNVQPQQQYVPTSLQGIQTAMAGTPQQSQPQLAPATVPVTQVPVLAQQQTSLIQQPSLNAVAAVAGVSSGLPPSNTIHPVVVMQPATAMTVPLAPVGQPPPSSNSQSGVGLPQPTLVAQHSSIQQQQSTPSQPSVPGSMTVLQGPPPAVFDVNQQQSIAQSNHLVHQQAVPTTTLGVASQPLTSNSEPVQHPIQPQHQSQQQQQVHHTQQPVIQQQQQPVVAPVQSHTPQQTVVPPPVLVQQQQPTQSSSTVPIVLPVYTSAQGPSVHPVASSAVVSSTTATVTATSVLGGTGGGGGGGVLGAVGSVVVEKDGPETHAGEEPASAAGGSSTVAIDNKIEQAMDLVKSHLMFAVREEVEVLKERIAELEERIAFLESENAILRSTATQDALAQIAHLETTFNPTAVSMADGGNTIVATASAAAGPVVMPGSSINISVASTATNTVPNASSTQPANGAPPAAP